jgi:DNA-binding XRE family transcriptional regulator
MLVLEKTLPTKLVITGEPEEVKEIERMFDFLHQDETSLEREEWIDGDLVQREILDYLDIPLGALMLKHYREHRGLSYEALVDVLGFSIQNIHDLETGKAQITDEIAEQLAAFFHVPVHTFLKK